jgi:hypothetical protein
MNTQRFPTFLARTLPLTASHRNDSGCIFKNSAASLMSNEIILTPPLLCLRHSSFCNRCIRRHFDRHSYGLFFRRFDTVPFQFRVDVCVRNPCFFSQFLRCNKIHNSPLLPASFFKSFKSRASFFIANTI